MSKQASPAPALTGSETEHTGELRKSALLLAAAAFVSQRRRLICASREITNRESANGGVDEMNVSRGTPPTSSDSRRGHDTGGVSLASVMAETTDFAWDDEISSVDSPAACRDLLASLFGVATRRIRFHWADATMPVHEEREGHFEPTLDADWILDPGGVVVKFDWCFTVTVGGDEIPDLLTRGLVFEAETGEFVVTPGLLMRLRDAIPIWHDIALVIEVGESAEEPVSGYSLIPVTDETGTHRQSVGRLPPNEP